MRVPTILLAVLCTALLVPLGIQVTRLLDLRASDGVLQEAVQAEGAAALRLLSTLSARQNVTPRQWEWADRIARSAWARAFQAQHPVSTVDGTPYDGSGEVFETGRSLVTLMAEVALQESMASVEALMVGDLRTPFENGRVVTSLSLPPDGTVRVFPLQALVRLPSGNQATIPLPGPLSLRQDTSVPTFSASVGSVPEPLGPEISNIVVPPAQPVTLSVVCDRPLTRAWVVFGGEPVEKEFGAPTREWTHPLALQTKNFGIHSVEVGAENDLGTVRSVLFSLNITPPDWLPLQGATFAGCRLDDAEVPVPTRAGRLELTLESGAGRYAHDLTVRLDDGGATPLVSGSGDLIFADVQLASWTEAQSLGIYRGELRLRSFVVLVDDKPPEITVAAGEMAIAPDGFTIHDPGTTIWISVRDRQLDRVEIIASGLEYESVQKSQSEQVFQVTVPEEGEFDLSVAGTDALGNHNGPLVWHFRPRRPVRVLAFRPRAREDPDSGWHINLGDLAFQLDCDGDGRILVAVTDPLRPGAPIGTPQAFDPASNPIPGAVDLHVSVGEEADRTVTITDEAGTTLHECTLHVDRVPPRICHAAETGREGTAVVAVPGTRMALRVIDAGRGPILEASVPILARSRRGHETTVELGVPEDLPAMVWLRAEDQAGNFHLLEFEVRSSSLASVTVEVVSDGRPVQPLELVRVRRPSDLKVRIAGGVLERAWFGGSELGVSLKGDLEDPISVPLADGLRLAVKDLGGGVRDFYFDVRLRPFEVSSALRQRMQNARAYLDGKRLDHAQRELSGIEKDLSAEAEPYLRTEAARAFRVELKQLQDRLRGFGAQALAPTLRNPLDEAQLCRVTPVHEGVAFSPYYIYESEITQGMYRRFWAAVGDDPGFWVNVPDHNAPARSVRDPVALRDKAGALVSPRGLPQQPVAGFEADIAMAYVHWAKDGLPDGTLTAPSLDLWRFAAGRAVNPGAIYPTTGADHSGGEMERVNTLGGANFGNSGRETPNLVGSQAPGAFGLVDMAGNLWELVRDRNNQWLIIGGAVNSTKEDCLLDSTIPENEAQTSLVGFRPLWIPPQ